MPFKAGNQLGKKNLGRRKESPKTIWVKEALEANGYNFERTLVGFLDKAAKGDRHAYAMAELLIKLVPHLANAPKAERPITNIETLVIHRHDPARAVTPPAVAVDAEVIAEGDEGRHPATE
jgi:hypothetical protein